MGLWLAVFMFSHIVYRLHANLVSNLKKRFDSFNGTWGPTTGTYQMRGSSPTRTHPEPHPNPQIIPIPNSSSPTRTHPEPHPNPQIIPIPNSSSPIPNPIIPISNPSLTSSTATGVVLSSYWRIQTNIT